MTLLDELGGFEFERVMVEVFRHRGYEDVRQAETIADEGRDVTMVDVRGRGPPVGVVVECKHTDVVSRPVIQKTHSAAITYEYDGPVRGMVATTGRFTEPAREYAERVTEDPEHVDVELLDGQDLRDTSEAIGLDLYNGKIEVHCEEALRPPTDRDDLEDRLDAAAADVHNLDEWTLAPSVAAVRFEPVVVADAAVDATFETDAGEIHAVDERAALVLRAGRDGPSRVDPEVATLVREAFDDRLSVDALALEAAYDRVDIERFDRTVPEYREWVTETLREEHAETVSYTGDNDVTYERTCRPDASDVTVETCDPVYLPHVAVAASPGEYRYEVELYAAGGEVLVRDSEFDACVHCGSSGTLTYCANCGAIACREHVAVERVVGEPVCTGCAVTESFAGARKYFYDETNRETFRAAYESMPLYRKVLENRWLSVAIAVVAVFLLAVAVGVLGSL